MGRGKKQWPQQQRDYSWSSEASPSWKLWEGSWSASPKAPPPTQLRYDQVTVKTTRPTARADPSSGWSEDSLGDFAGQHHRDVQKALTQARKADIRVRKLKEDIAHRKLQQQKKRFQADVQKQEQEIQDAMEAGKQAAQMMHDIVLHGSTAEAPDPTADKDWEELTRDDKMEVEDGPGFLQAAMSAARAVRASQRDPVTPPRRTATAAPMTPAHNVTEEMAKQIALMYHAMQANVEPYQASPGQNKTPPPPAPASTDVPGAETGDRSASRARPKPPDATRRLPVKHGPLGVAHPASTGDKAIARRLEAARMEASKDATNHPPEGANGSPHLVPDDDDDSLDSHRERAPSLGKME